MERSVLGGRASDFRSRGPGFVTRILEICVNLVFKHIPAASS